MTFTCVDGLKKKKVVVRMNPVNKAFQSADISLTGRTANSSLWLKKLNPNSDLLLQVPICMKQTVIYVFTSPFYLYIPQ